jgi:transketolase
MSSVTNPGSAPTSQGTIPPADATAIDTVRTLAMDAVQQAGSGHPGTAMALAPAAYVLWTRFLAFDPAHPDWPNRDRFVLSAGHAAVLQYAVLHLTGYDLPLAELQRLRQWESVTPGHPEYGDTPGVEVTTGPLGQGVGNAVGIAMAERFLADRYNRDGHPVVDFRTWVFASDGDMMEGVAAEAASVAGHLGLGKLTVVYDDNRITIDGPTALSLDGEDVAARYAAYGWHVQDVADANDLEEIAAAYAAAVEETDRPSFIRLRSHIAWGAPNKQDTSAAHGSPLGSDEIRAAKEFYGWDPDKHFVVPDGATDRWRAGATRGAAARQKWTQALDAYAAAFPELAAELRALPTRELPAGWDAKLDGLFDPPAKMATRKASGAILNALVPGVPTLLGGSADLASSNSTALKGEDDFGPHTVGRNVHYGVREHAMGAISNGLALTGLRPFAATFLIFSDYMRPALRLAAIMKQPTIYVFTHDSIGLGEDGPTHQPVEHLAMLRATPGLRVIRPADTPETAEAWRAALRRTDGPTAIVLTRQDLPPIDRTAHAAADGLHRGAYVLAEASTGTPELILIASGSEVAVAMDAQSTLEAEGVPTRVVSMPSWELFDWQDAAYRDQVLPPAVTARLAVEAASPFGWSRWVGDRGDVVGINTFGSSAPGGEVLDKYGINAANVVTSAKALLPARD